jgi:hypothetical protein
MLKNFKEFEPKANFKARFLSHVSFISSLHLVGKKYVLIGSRYPNMMIAVQVGRCHSKGGLLWERGEREKTLDLTSKQKYYQK